MAGGTKRFLVVDDERHVVRLIQVNLERNGCHVTVAHGGQQAIDILSQQSFDRVFVDYDMPQVNGYQVLEFIRTNERLKGIWVLLVTTRSDDREAIMGFPHKADSYGEKPFNPVDWMD
ncbi:MAG: response regulator [Armatimonadota bacterium]